MAAFLALGTTLEEDAVGTIFSFLEDSSVVTYCGTDASDIANLDDLETFGAVHYMKGLNKGLNYWLYHGSLEFFNTI